MSHEKLAFEEMNEIVDVIYDRYRERVRTCPTELLYEEWTACCEVLDATLSENGWDEKEFNVEVHRRAQLEIEEFDQLV